jgi:hypothetical protein
MHADGIEEGLLVSGYKFRRPPEVMEGEALRRTRQPMQVKEGSEVKLGLLSTKPAWKKLGKVLLGFAGQFYTTERTITIVGPDRTYQWIDFKGTDFANLAADIKVEEIPYYPENRQTMRETVVSLLSTDAGRIFFTNPEGQLDQDRIRVAAEAVGIDVALSALDPDVLEARNEISMVRAGQPIQYMDYQNSEAHLVEKLAVLKSLAFKGWSPASQQGLMENIQQHKEALAKQQQEQEQTMVDQEQKLRQIRAETEAMGKTRQALAEKLLDLVMDMLKPEAGEPQQKE